MTAPDYDALWNAIPHPALALNPAGAVSAFNAAAEQFFSMSARGVQGRSFDEFAPPGTRLAT